LVKLQFRKRSNLKVIYDAAKLVSWTIPRSGGYNPAVCFGVHTRGSLFYAYH